MADTIRAAIHVHKKAWAALKAASNDVLSEARTAERDALRILVRIPPRDNRDATERIKYLCDYYADFLSRTYHEEQRDGPQLKNFLTPPEAREGSN